ncbi:MAG: hypothetical protein HKL96_07920 [Phycisphaerales bacterium]|nr:hypothetical protein [Phycisphaerales bacterium]
MWRFIIKIEQASGYGAGRAPADGGLLRASLPLRRRLRRYSIAKSGH